MLPASWEARLAAVAATFVVALAGCGQLGSEPMRAPSEPMSPAAVPPAERVDGAGSFGLYSTLPGKMARMEELYNAIDRFLGDPDFRGRVIRDAEEFRRLLIESRGLYPEALVARDEPGFDRAIDSTVATSEALLGSLRSGDVETARQALSRLGEQRREAHSSYSY